MQPHLLLPAQIQNLFAFTCTGTTIILWDFYENAFDFLFGTTMVRGLEDTIMDMFIGLMGALVLTLFYRRSYNKSLFAFTHSNINSMPSSRSIFGAQPRSRHALA